MAVRARPSLDREKLEKLEEQLDQYAQGARLIRATPGLLPQVLLMSMGQLACSYAAPYIIDLAFHLTGSSFVEVFALQVLCSTSVGYAAAARGGRRSGERVPPGVRGGVRRGADRSGDDPQPDGELLSGAHRHRHHHRLSLDFRGRETAPADTARQLESQGIWRLRA